MLKNIGKNVVKTGVPAAIGGAAAGAVHSAVEKYSVDKDGADMFGDNAWAKPLVPGLVGVVLSGNKKESVRHAASAMIGYSIGTAVKPKVDEALNDEVLASDLDDLGLND